MSTNISQKSTSTNVNFLPNGIQRLLLHESKEGVESQGVSNTAVHLFAHWFETETPCKGSWCDQKNLFYLVIDMFVIGANKTPWFYFGEMSLKPCQSSFSKWARHWGPLFKAYHRSWLSPFLPKQNSHSTLIAFRYGLLDGVWTKMLLTFWNETLTST